MKKARVLESYRIEYNPQFCQLPVVWPWVSSLSSLILDFLTYKMKTITPYLSGLLCEVNYVCEKYIICEKCLAVYMALNSCSVNKVLFRSFVLALSFAANVLIPLLYAYKSCLNIWWWWTSSFLTLVLNHLQFLPCVLLPFNPKSLPCWGHRDSPT